MAHKTKGTGAGYGFPTLTELGAALDAGSHVRSDSAAILSRLSEYGYYVEKY